jgi:quercetin dioxygenase-like cupin family protein
MTDATRAVIVGLYEGTLIEGPVGGPLTFKVRGEQTNGTFTAFENVIPPGQGPPLHTHANEDESWYVIEGELRFKLDGDVHLAPAGSFVFVPRGTPHCFQNVAERGRASL